MSTRVPVSRLAIALRKWDRALRRAGHETVLVCNDYVDAGGVNRLGEMSVCRIGPTFSARSLNHLLKFPVFCNPIWLWSLAAAVARIKPDVIPVGGVPEIVRNGVTGVLVPPHNQAVMAGG